MYIELGKRHPTVNTFGIFGFFDEYRFLSNFQDAPLLLQGQYADGIRYPTSEHAYMAQKTRDLVERQRIAALPRPSMAKDEGQLIVLRADWETYKQHAMLAAIRAKFRQNPELAQRLLATHLLYLEETNNWGDQYWGVVDGVGLNMLGKILMQVRMELQLNPGLITQQKWLL